MLPFLFTKLFSFNIMTTKNFEITLFIRTFYQQLLRKLIIVIMKFCKTKRLFGKKTTLLFMLVMTSSFFVAEITVGCVLISKNQTSCVFVCK